MIKNTYWLPDEEICNKLGRITKNQRKIAKRTKSFNTYYTIEMLKHDCKISKGIKGIDPDKPLPLQIKKWFEKHPAITDEQRENMRKAFLKRLQKAS